MISVIVFSPDFDYNHSVQSLYHLGLLDEMEVWLDSLIVQYRFSTSPFGPARPVPIRENFQDDLRITLHVIDELLGLCERIAESEMTSVATRAGQSGGSVRTRIRQYRSGGQRVREFLQFWDCLDHSRILARGLLQNSPLQRREFRSFGYFLVDQIERFKRSDSYAYLRRKFHDWDHAELIQRRLVSNLEMEGIREQLQTVFLKFLEILALVNFMEAQMSRGFQYRKLRLLMTLCYHSCRRFRKLLSESAQYLDSYYPELADNLIGTNLALRMEMRRVFETELRDIPSVRRIDEVYARMQNALGLLQNAFRDSFTQLATQINPKFDDFSFFPELVRKHQESVTLIEDLNRLLDCFQAAESALSSESWDRLMKAVESFHDGSMRLLYFRDWAPFEGFMEEVQFIREDEREFCIHRFGVFVSTLLSEVKKRTVLQRRPPRKTRTRQGAEGS